MTLKEKALYHQIHPVKLCADISASILTLYLFWQHIFLIALILHFLIPIIGSILVIHFADFKKEKNSSLGKYLKKYMTNMMQLLRLGGDIIMVFGAWFHSPLIILAGLTIVLFGWFRGRIFT